MGNQTKGPELKVVEQKKEKEKPDYYPFRFRSTGLGKTVLQGQPIGIEVIGDMLVLKIQATIPVQWQIRAALTFRGLLEVLKMALKPSVIKFVLFGFKTLKNPNLTDEF
ncbi:MAG TPA: hypothetical protein PKV48_02860 [Thermodesulfobacteriota bacterium]|nr:hypothetical protein [Thermodesulfobacteriota bacterium]